MEDHLQQIIQNFLFLNCRGKVIDEVVWALTFLLLVRMVNISIGKEWAPEPLRSRTSLRLSRIYMLAQLKASAVFNQREAQESKREQATLISARSPPARCPYSFIATAHKPRTELSEHVNPALGSKCWSATTTYEKSKRR